MMHGQTIIKLLETYVQILRHDFIEYGGRLLLDAGD